MKKENKLTKNEKLLIILIFLYISIMVFSTKYYGSTDIGDYADTAKYFAGDYSAKLRSSHSYLFGFIHFPLYKLFKSLIIFKITSLIFLFLLVYSVYIATNKKAMWLMLFSPIIWYLSPWINSIQMASLLFFWGYYFLRKYDREDKKSYIVFGGVLIGLSWAFWDAVLFFSIIAAFVFFIDKKFYNSLLFLMSLALGLLPKLVLDTYQFGFAFSGILRYLFGMISAAFFGGVNGNISAYMNLIDILILLLFFPLFSYKLFSKEFIIKNKKPVIFISLCLLLILLNLQIRYFLPIAAIIIYELGGEISKKLFKKQIIFSIIIIGLLLIPYAVQIKYSTNAEELNSFIKNLNNLSFSESQKDIIGGDIKDLVKEYPNEVFVVGNQFDDYQYLASRYNGNDVKEFVSIQDYNLAILNKTILFEKKFMPVPAISERRQIWLAGGLSKNQNDLTNYANITLGIGLGEPINITGFSLVKKYNSLYLSRL